MPSTEYEIFSGLPAAVSTTLVERLTPRIFHPGEVVIRENEPNGRVYLIEEGEIRVWKGDPGSLTGVCVAVLAKGNCFGEMSALSAAPASATVVAETRAVVRELALRDLPAEGGVRETVTLNVARTLVNRLSGANTAIQTKHTEQQKSLRLLISATAFLTRVLIALSFYMFALPVVKTVRPSLPSDIVISSFFVVMFFWVAWTFMRQSQLELADFGMSLKDWPRQIGRSLLWSAPILVIFFVAKGWLVWAFPGHFQLFEPMRLLNAAGESSYPHWFFFTVVYVSLCFAQEFIRCAVQGSLALFYSATGSPARWRAILVANVVFASLHVHLGNTFALAAFIPGLFWGWLYAREHSYLSAAFSHGITGLWIVCIVGVPS